jgi:hypothetical protein
LRFKKSTVLTVQFLRIFLRRFRLHYSLKYAASSKQKLHMAIKEGVAQDFCATVFGNSPANQIKESKQKNWTSEFRLEIIH